MRTTKAIMVSISVSAFLRMAYFSSSYYVREAAQKILRNYDTYKDLYIHSVDIYNSNGNTVFNIHFSRYYDLPPVHTFHVFDPNFSINDYDFRALRTYFKSYISH